MNILILGSGGRECTLAWKLAQSENCEKLFIAPGNAGTLEYGRNLQLNPNNFEDVKRAVQENEIQMVVVGPEDPLVLGIHDFFLEDPDLKTIPVIGPQKLAARLEGSKEFAKEFMYRHQIPTAKYQSFTAASLQDGYAFLESLNPPYVLKADGLAAGLHGKHRHRQSQFLALFWIIHRSRHHRQPRCHCLRHRGCVHHTDPGLHPGGGLPGRVLKLTRFVE